MRHFPMPFMTPTGLAAALLACGAMSAGFEARAGDLSGSWRGGGSVSFLSGKAERARCRANFSKRSSTSYIMKATCATASGSVSQSTTVRKVGSNRFRGSFYNPEWDTSGSITVRVSGRSLSANVNATKASASMRLSR